MADGEGCNCFAKSAGECCCPGVDWRSEREVFLEEEVAELRRELAAIKELCTEASRRTLPESAEGCELCRKLARAGLHSVRYF